MSKITYENKVALNQNPSIPDINKVNDTDMNMIKNVVNNNETKVLLAVSSSAPATCDTGDIYFNTTDNLIYTATATNTWGATGVAPTKNTIYIEFTSQTAYAYNGTTLVSVGGGSGSEIVVGDEEPTEDTKMIIDTDAFDPQYSDITDEYSEANNKAYSCDFINGKVLYENASGTSSNISLGTDDVSNYRYIEITAINTDNTQETFSIFKFDTSLSTYIMMGESVSSSSFNIFTKKYTKGVNQLIASQGELYSGSTGRVSNYEVFKIIKVIGYNKVGE